jgi:hypothetical protein
MQVKGDAACTLPVAVRTCAVLYNWVACWGQMQASMRTHWGCHCPQQPHHFVTHGSGQRSCSKGYQQSPWCLSSLQYRGTRLQQQTARKVS